MGGFGGRSVGRWSMPCAFFSAQKAEGNALLDFPEEFSFSLCARLC